MVQLQLTTLQGERLPVEACKCYMYRLVLELQQTNKKLII